MQHDQWTATIIQRESCGIILHARWPFDGVSLMCQVCFVQARVASFQVAGSRGQAMSKRQRLTSLWCTTPSRLLRRANFWRSEALRTTGTLQKPMYSRTCYCLQLNCHTAHQLSEHLVVCLWHPLK